MKITAEDIPPTWYCFEAPPRHDAHAREFLRTNGVFAFFPSEERSRPNPRGDRKRITWEAPTVGGYVFGLFNARPLWHIITKPRFITRPFCIGDRPYKFSPAIMKQMQGLTVEAEKLWEAEAELRRLKPGDRAKIMEGPLAGRPFTVESINGDQISYDAGAFKGSARACIVEKIA